MIRLSALLMLLALFVLLAAPALSAPVAITVTQEGATITLYDEPCRLSAVANLHNRATWDEKGKRYEGCFSIMAGIVVSYYEDRTVALGPAHGFRSVRGI